MPERLVPETPVMVALRKESVDRNCLGGCGTLVASSVALRKESVDRNKIASARGSGGNCRSPQGERG